MGRAEKGGRDFTGSEAQLSVAEAGLDPGQDPGFPAQGPGAPPVLPPPQGPCLPLPHQREPARTCSFSGTALTPHQLQGTDQSLLGCSAPSTPHPTRPPRRPPAHPGTAQLAPVPETFFPANQPGCCARAPQRPHTTGPACCRPPHSKNFLSVLQ